MNSPKDILQEHRAKSKKGGISSAILGKIAARVSKIPSLPQRVTARQAVNPRENPRRTGSVRQRGAPMAENPPKKRRIRGSSV